MISTDLFRAVFVCLHQYPCLNMTSSYSTNKIKPSGSCDDLLAGFGCSMCLSQLGACMMYANHIQELCSNNMLSCLVCMCCCQELCPNGPKGPEITSRCERPERNICPEHVCTCYVLTKECKNYLSKLYGTNQISAKKIGKARQHSADRIFIF